MKKVVMFGGAGTKAPVPEIVEGVERWTINNLVILPTGPKRCKGATRHFDLHSKDHIEGRRQANMWGRYQKMTIPVYLWQTYPDLPTSTVYPLADVRAMFGGTRLFTSSLDWLLALALFEGFEEIELFAYRMGHPHYMHQVSSGQWWLRQCAERGVKVTHLSPTALESVARRASILSPQPGPEHLMYGLETTDRTKLYRGR
jgi:hypothetical protein